MKLTQLFDLYARKRLRVASPNTHRLYRHSIAAFEVTLKREATTLDLIDDNLDDAIRESVIPPNHTFANHIWLVNDFFPPT